MENIDLSTWNRKPHYDFFKSFDEPFWGVTFNVDVSHLLEHCKQTQKSIFISYLYASICAVNETESFRLRIKENDTVVRYPYIDASATINRPDGTFGFSRIRFDQNYNTFYQFAKAEIELVKNQKDLVPGTTNDNVIHYSSLPWIQFSSITHARRFKILDSTPKLSFGKIFIENDKSLMPHSVYVNHALCDGKDVGLYAERFQQNLDGLS